MINLSLNILKNVPIIIVTSCYYDEQIEAEIDQQFPSQSHVITEDKEEISNLLTVLQYDFEK